MTTLDFVPHHESGPVCGPTWTKNLASGTAACGDDGTLVVVIHSCRDSPFGKLETEQLLASIYLFHSTAHHLGHVLRRRRPLELLNKLQYSAGTAELSCTTVELARMGCMCTFALADRSRHACAACQASRRVVYAWPAADIGQYGEFRGPRQQHHCSGYTNSADTCSRPSAAAVFNYSSHLLQCTCTYVALCCSSIFRLHSQQGSALSDSPHSRHRKQIARRLEFRPGAV